MISLVIEGFFHITYVQNTGMAWSLLSGHRITGTRCSSKGLALMGWYLFIKEN